MVDHLIQCDGQRRFVPRHNIGCRIADQKYIYARGVQNTRRRIVIGRQHGDRHTGTLQVLQCLRGDPPRVKRTGN